MIALFPYALTLTPVDIDETGWIYFVSAPADGVPLLAGTRPVSYVRATSPAGTPPEEVVYEEVTYARSRWIAEVRRWTFDRAELADFIVSGTPDEIAAQLSGALVAWPGRSASSWTATLTNPENGTGAYCWNTEDKQWGPCWGTGSTRETALADLHAKLVRARLVRLGGRRHDRVYLISAGD